MNTDFSAAITPSIITDPFLQEPFTFMSAPNTVLDENDQKAFSSFLDAFFMDPEMQFPSNNNTNNFYAFNNHNQEPSPQEENELEEKEEYRRSSILQSLDEQKMLHQRLSLIASLPTSPSITADQCRLRSPSINNTSSVTSEDDMPQSIYLRQSDSISSPYTNNNNRKRTLQVTHEKSTTNKKSRTNKELLTEEEKRANHIASEQKRRSTIRNGFKDLTDLIPTLKNINNSKSTVLFKAVDFIKYLEKRTKTLKEKVGSLELRVEVEGRMTNNNTNYPNQPDNTIIITDEEEEEQVKKKEVVVVKKEIIEKKKEPIKPLLKQIKKPTVNNHQYNNTYMNQTSHLQGLPANARNALLAHKTQQKQLLILQEQLQLHQRLIAQQQEMKERSMISVKNKLPPILGQYDTPSTKSFLLKELEDKSISAP